VDLFHGGESQRDIYRAVHMASVSGLYHSPRRNPNFQRNHYPSSEAITIRNTLL
jgi:hypothetical protein